MKRLLELVGSEHPLDTNARAMRDFARDQNAAVFGAMHVTCSDESERECVDSFQRWFADELLSTFEYSNKSPFRTATLGGRYEWGSAALAENHFLLPASPSARRLLFIKVNSHVAVTQDGDDYSYGTMDRYGASSQFCGAMHAVLAGRQTPAIRSLSESFHSEGIDRIAILNDPSLVAPNHRLLLAAVANARLQARCAILDIQSTPPAEEVSIVVLPCVTINRVDRDTELIVGAYTADLLAEKGEIQYCGLGDDPSQYQFALRENMIVVDDDVLHRSRPARDHRQIIIERWRERPNAVLMDDDKLGEIVLLTERVASSPSVAKEVLKTLLRLLADAALVPTAIMLFVDGIAGIHNIYPAYRLATGNGQRDDAEDIVDEAIASIATLAPQQVKELVGRLCQQHGIAVETGNRTGHEADIAPATVESNVTVGSAEAANRNSENVGSDSPGTNGSIQTVEPTLSAHRPARSSDSSSSATEVAPPSMELQLNVGSQLQFSTMPEPNLELSEASSLGELSLDSGLAATADSRAAATAAVRQSTPIETEAIVDRTPEVTAIETPDIKPVMTSIVDTAKEVAEIATPEIATGAPDIVDEAKQVAEMESPAIVSQAMSIPADETPRIQVSSVPAFDKQRAPSLPTAPLREMHVVQPSTNAPQPADESEMVIEAEVISGDEAEDAIIIIDDEYRIR